MKQPCEPPRKVISSIQGDASPGEAIQNVFVEETKYFDFREYWAQSSGMRKLPVILIPDLEQTFFEKIS